MMYAKLIFRNVRRSLSDYLIYIMTLIICVTLFYAFLSISSSFYHPEIGVEYNLLILSDGIQLAVCTVTLLILFLIHYVNHFMLRRRQREFAVQTIMGMEQRTTAWLFFAETFLMGAVSVGIGILSGSICSQFITAMLLSAFGQPYRFTWTLFPDTAGLTICFFAASFLIVGLQNVRTIRKIKIIDMLNSDRKGNGDFKKSLWMPIICIFYLLTDCLMLISGISNYTYYFDTRYALPVHILYYGNILVPAAALLYSLFWLFRKPRKADRLAAVLTFSALLNTCLAAILPGYKMKYLLPLHSGIINKYLLFLAADFIYLICALFYLSGNVITAMKNLPVGKKYENENLFLYGQLLSKLKSTTKTMSLICLTLVLSVLLFLAAPALTGWASGYLDSRSTYDIQIYSEYNQTLTESELPTGNYEPVTEFLSEKNIETAYDFTFDLYLPGRKDFHHRYKYSFPVNAMSVSDYNYLLNMRGCEPISLEEHEFSTQWNRIATEEEKAEFLNLHQTVETDSGVLVLSDSPEQNADLGNTLYNLYTNVVYIFPDSVCENLLAVRKNRYIDTVKPLPFTTAQELELCFTERFDEDVESGSSYHIRTRTMQTNDTISNNFVLRVCMTYCAIVLLVICFTILALQQLSDSVHYKRRFSILRNMGVEQVRLDCLILKQLAIWFGMPVLMAIAASLVLVIYFFNIISVQIAAYVGTAALTVQVGIISGILVVLLGCYFVGTWVLFKKGVEGEKI